MQHDQIVNLPLYDIFVFTFLCKKCIIRSGKKTVSAAPTKSDRGQVVPIASHAKCFCQEPRSRRLTLTASAGQHFLPALHAIHIGEGNTMLPNLLLCLNKLENY